MASGAVATLRASLGEEGDGACFDALTTVGAGWNASGAQGRDAAAIDEEVERVLSDHFDVVCACACVSERCSSLAQHVARAVATRCSAREAYALLMESLRDATAGAAPRWSSALCAATGIAVALGRIPRKRDLYLRSSLSLLLDVGRKAASVQARAGVREADDDARDDAKTSGRVISEIVAVVRIAVQSQQSASDGDGSDRTVIARRTLTRSCFGLLGAVCSALEAGQPGQAAPPHAAWQADLCQGLWDLGVRSPQAVAPPDEEEGSDDEGDEACAQDCALGAAVALAHFTKHAGEGERHAGFLDGATCEDLMDAMALHFRAMLEHGESKENAMAVLFRSLLLVKSVAGAIEARGGLRSTSQAHEEVRHHLLQIMSYAPVHKHRMEAKNALHACLRALQDAARCDAMVRWIDECDIPPVRATAITMLKDEMAGAWDAQAAVLASPFLSRAAIDCVLEPLLRVEDLRKDEDAVKLYMEASSDCMLSAMNTLRFLILRARSTGLGGGALSAATLERLRGRTLGLIMAAAVNTVAAKHRKLMLQRWQPVSRGSTNWTCAFGCPPTASGGCQHAGMDPQEHRVLLNLMALEEVAKRLRELCEEAS